MIKILQPTVLPAELRSNVFVYRSIIYYFDENINRFLKIVGKLAPYISPSLRLSEYASLYRLLPQHSCPTSCTPYFPINHSEIECSGKTTVWSSNSRHPWFSSHHPWRWVHSGILMFIPINSSYKRFTSGAPRWLLHTAGIYIRPRHSTTPTLRPARKP